MTHAFVLIDALPGREKDVYAALSKVPAIRVRRQLKQKIANCEFIALLDAADGNAVDRIITGSLRGISGVHSVRRVEPEHTIAGPLGKVMEEMEREAAR